MSSLNNQILRVRNVLSNMDLAHNPTDVVLWSTVQVAADQTWKFLEVAGQENTYFLINAQFNQALDWCPGKVCTTQQSLTKRNQWWKLVPVDGQPGAFRLLNVGTNTYLLASGNTPGVTLLLSALVPDKNEYWHIIPPVNWDVHCTGMVYDPNALKSLVGSPDIFWSAGLQNSTNGTIRQRISKSITRSSTFEFSFSQTLSISATVEFSAGIPLIGSINVGITLGLELSASQRWTKTVDETYTIDSEVEIPPNTNAHLLGSVDWLDNAAVPFKMMLKVRAKYYDGTPVANEQLKAFLYATGFSGVIANESMPYQVDVKIDGVLTGAWGINTSLTLIEPTPEREARSESLGSKKMYRIMGTSPIAFL